MVHTVFTVVAPVAPGDVGHVRTLLDAAGGTQLPVAVNVKTLPTLHFASMAVFDSQELPGGNWSMAYLVMQCCIDGPMGKFLDALVFLDGQQGNPLEKVFALCFERGDDSLRAYLEDKAVRPHLLHIGVPGMRLLHIHAGARLRSKLDTELDAIVTDGGANDDPLTLVDELRTRVKVPATAGVHSHLMADGWVEDPTTLARSRLWHWSKLIVFAVAVLLAVIGPILAAWWWRNTSAAVGVIVLEYGIVRLVKRWYFGSNNAPIELDPKHLVKLRELEDRRVQNHMCTFTIMRDSALRRAANRFVLFALNTVYRTWFTDVTPGRLEGLPTIHFGHWTQVPVADAGGKPTRHRALMFLSNYDGSWEAYLDDFIAQLVSGVAAIWGACVGFRYPMHGPVFKAYARNGMTVWNNWYTGEPDLTVLNIHNNDQIRKGLVRRPDSPEAARLWLSRFGSLKRGHEFIADSNGNLQAGDVQGVVLSGYGHLKFSSHVPLRIDDAAAASQWLRGLGPKIADGRIVPDKSQRSRRAVNIAFTYRGLQTLGLPPDACNAFPLVFREGIAPEGREHRSRALGDTGASEPGKWSWGGERTPDTRVDVLLLLYADSDAELKSLAKETYLEPLVDKKYAVVVGGKPIEGEMLPSAGKGPMSKFPAEHFGFVDGVSQPQIEGTWHGTKSNPTSPNDILKPGEFVLGYPDEAGLVTAGVPLDASDDAQGILPQLNGSPRVRDFGRNGSFLVARQLHQDVARFRKETEQWGGAHGPHGLAARMVGRTKDGLPLAEASSSNPANDFTFAGDPHGFKCPMGAHIRRANPRGSLGDDFDASLVATRRRRLLRRGRTYGKALPDAAAADDNATRGVMFICLNADIERQFEFVQQNWINNPVFSGVYDERDPGVGLRGPGGVVLTVQTEGVRDRVTNLAEFVTVKGGDYFFLPGMRALRYLAARPASATAANGSVMVPPAVHAQVVPMPPPTSAATASVQGLASALPALSRLVALRFQILTALVLLAFGLFGAGRANRIGPSLYLAAHWGGVVVVAMLASLAASIVMLTTRLPLMYGDRLGLRPGRWLGPIRWPAVLAFQVLALPVVMATLHWTAVDATWLAGQRSNPWAYLVRLDFLLLPALAGFALAWLLLGVAARASRLGPAVRLKLRVTRWALARVPRSVGIGYVDYENRRLLPGHGRLLAIAVVLAFLYLVGAVVLNPLWAWSRTLSEQVPSVAYLLTPVLAAGLVLPVVAFFLDRYRVPVLVVAAVVLFLMLRMPSDHYFRVGQSLAPGATPGAALAASRAKHPTNRTIVVLGEGYGLVSSAWTARVLTELAGAEGWGSRFAGSVRLVSASSGASVGAMYFLDGYTSDGFVSTQGTAIRDRAGMPSSGEGGWGFAYPDRLRVVMPLLVPRHVDRGWAMEQAWRGRVSEPSATVSRWRSDTAAGWRPSVAFTTTLVETGERAVIATYDAGGPSATAGFDVPMVTAARLSATFPYISPPSRPDIDDDGPPRPHVIDGGLTDNLGWRAARDWLEAVQSDLGSERVLLLEIRSVPPVTPATPAGVESWLEELTAPLLSVVNARTREAARVPFEIDAFTRAWPGAIERVTFSLDDLSVPLSWNLGRADATRLNGAWSRKGNRDSRLAVCRFVAEDPSTCQ